MVEVRQVVAKLFTTALEQADGIKPLNREYVDANPDLLGEACWHLPMGVSDAF